MKMSAGMVTMSFTILKNRTSCSLYLSFKCLSSKVLHHGGDTELNTLQSVNIFV
jgi:hypothetical protein